MNFRQAVVHVYETLRPRIKRVLTVNRRTVFWCDSRKWLCYCCHRCRDKYISRMPGAFDKIGWVWNRWGSGWIWVLKEIDAPTVLVYKRHCVIILPGGMVMYTRVSREDMLDLVITIMGVPIRVQRTKPSELVTFEVNFVDEG